MLALNKIKPLIGCTDAAATKHFYVNLLGFEFLYEDEFALEFRMSEARLRLTFIQNFHPQPFCILAWEVEDIKSMVAKFISAGIPMEIYGMPGQDSRGIWKSPSGAMIAWFKDPAGNILSLVQY